MLKLLLIAFCIGQRCTVDDYSDGPGEHEPWDERDGRIDANGYAGEYDEYLSKPTDYG